MTPLWARVHLPSALRYPDFRNYWLGMVASVTGYQMLVLFCLGWLISHELDGDARYLGYMGTAIAVPAILLNLFGGVFADKLNPKHLLGLTQSITGGIVLGVAVLTLTKEITHWHVLVGAFLIGTVQAFDNPTRQSIFPRLIDRKALPAAVALNSSVWTGTRIFAPAIAGVIVEQMTTISEPTTAISTAIFISAAGFLTLSLVSQTLRPSPVERAGGRVFKEMMMGFTFIKETPLFFILIGMTFCVSFFGMSYVFLMPVFADEVLKVGAQKLGLLMGAAGLGALTGIIVGARLTRFQHRGWVIVGGAGFFGVFLILFAITSNAELYGLSMLMLFLGDMSISIYLMMVMTTIHTFVADRFRGRVMGFYSITWSLIPLGGLMSSQIAYHKSAPLAVAIGGALVVVLALGIALGSSRVRAITGPSDR